MYSLREDLVSKGLPVSRSNMLLQFADLPVPSKNEKYVLIRGVTGVRQIVNALSRKTSGIPGLTRPKVTFECMPSLTKILRFGMNVGLHPFLIIRAFLSFPSYGKGVMPYDESLNNVPCFGKTLNEFEAIRPNPVDVCELNVND